MKKIIEVYNKIEAHALVISLIFTTLLIFCQVFFRYVLENSLSWSEELARYIFIWQIWLGTSISMKEKDHIDLDMLRNKLSPNGKLILSVISKLILLAFCVFLTVYGWDLVSSMIQRGNISAAMGLKLWTIYLALPFSQAIVSLRIIGHIVSDIKAFINPSKEVEA